MDNEKILDELIIELKKTDEGLRLLQKVMEKVSLQKIRNQFKEFVHVDDVPLY